MKYLKLFESFENIKEICKQYNITNYTINPDGSIDVNDFDIFRDEDTNKPSIIMDRLNDFLEMIGRNSVKKVEGYKNI